MLDEQLGRVLDRLDALGLAENTFVFLAGDNGFMHGSHGHKAKQVWFEESARTPALARWPGRIPPGSIVSAPVGAVDLLPTVLELAGAAPRQGLEGRSMIPALTGGKPLREVAFAEVQMGTQRDVEVGDHWQMVREGYWKYVRFRKAPEQLYDLESDPDEQKDLAADPAREEVLTRMRRRLDAWLAATPSS
jgi:arylsulfatase A-like enzyme